MARRALALIVWLVLPLAAEDVRVRVAGAGIVTMDVEDYLGGVLLGEAGGLRPEEALRAMAVVARTYARVNAGRHAAEGFDFCETTHCQDFRAGAVPERFREAARATEGLILWASGKPALVYYTAHCGGRGESAGAVWPAEARPWLQGGPDTFCLSAGRGDWSSTVRASDLARALVLSAVTELRILRRTATGRVALLRVNGRLFDAGDFESLVGRALGWTILRSRLYDGRLEGATVRFEGWGRGHGVGLCQAGAEERARAGQDWRTILAAYFPGTMPGLTSKAVAWRAAHTEHLDVWVGGAAGDDEVPRAAERALAEAGRRIGAVLGRRAVLRVFPSVAAFREATNEPGFIAASTRGRTIRLQPAGRLIEEHRLDRVLLHEMLHLLLDPQPGVPRWFEEGLVLWMENPTGPAAPLRAGTEERLTRPRSEAELRGAYRDARAAVAWLARRYDRTTLLGWLRTGLPPGLF
jgi:stage II sporulation protein D